MQEGFGIQSRCAGAGIPSLCGVPVEATQRVALYQHLLIHSMLHRGVFRIRTRLVSKQ